MHENVPAAISKKSILIGIIVMTAIILLTVVTIFKNLNGKDIWGLLKSIPFVVIPSCFLLMLGYSFFEGLNMQRALRLAGYRISVWKSWKYAIAGFFYSGITPSSSGGQPMQIYHMYQDGICASDGLLAVIMQLFGHEGAIIFLGLTGFVVMHEGIIQSAGHLKYLILLGIVLHLLYFLFLLVVLFTKRGIQIASNVLISIVKKFDLKKSSKPAKKIISILEDYRGVSEIVINDKHLIWKAILTGILQFTCLFGIPAIIYAGFGLSEYGFFKILLLQSVIFISVGFIPVPGSAGISEGMAFLLYQLIYPTAFVGSAVLLGRCFSMYFVIIVYGLVLGFIQFMRKGLPDLRDNHG